MKTVPVYILHIPSPGVYSELEARVFGKKPGEKIPATTKVCGTMHEFNQAAEALGNLGSGRGRASDYLQVHTIVLNEVD